MNVEATRALQSSPQARANCWQTMQRWGAYNFLKVMARQTNAPATAQVSGYICLLPSISGQTPDEIARNLGLKAGQLGAGADIYQLVKLPERKMFEVRGYTTLVDGLRLAEGLKQDKAGYRAGWGSLQITLTDPVPAKLFARLAPGQRFTPPLHPKYRR